MEDFKELRKERLVTYPDPVLAGLAGSIDAMLIMVNALEEMEDWQRAIEFNNNDELEVMVNDKPKLEVIVNNIKFIMMERTMGMMFHMN